MSTRPNSTVELNLVSGRAVRMGCKAGIRRRRHRYGHRHRREDRREDVGVVECSTDTDTDFLVKILARKSRVSDVRMYRRVGQVGVCVGAVECELYDVTCERGRW